MTKSLVMTVGENNPNKNSTIAPHVVSTIDTTSGAAIATAIKVLMLGEFRNIDLLDKTITATEDGLVGDVPNEAHRGEKWKVVFNTVMGEFYFTIPTADKTLASPTTDLLDLSAGVGKLLFDALDGIVTDPYGNVGSIQYVKYINL